MRRVKQIDNQVSPHASIEITIDRRLQRDGVSIIESQYSGGTAG
jgi:hypothetical protein